MRIDLRQLQVLEAVARHGSLTLAARELNVTQPAISIQLRKLEETLGVALTQRAGRGIRLTEAGMETVQHAHRVTQVLDDLQENMRQHRGLVRGELRIAVVSTAHYFIHKDIALFRKRHPQIEVNLQVANRAGVAELMENNESDLAITGQPAQDSDLVARRFKPNPLGVIAPPDHPLAGRTGLTPPDLVAWPFVVREPGSGTRAAMEQAFRAHDLVCQVSCVLPTNEAVKQAVQAGLGLAVISLQTTELEQQAGRLVVLPCTALTLMRQWFLVYRNLRRLPPAAIAFRSQLLDEAPLQDETRFQNEPSSGDG